MAQRSWRESDEIAAFKFETIYGAIETEEIQFGHFKSNRKWENMRQIPTQQIRDALLNMIVYQGDTEFASVEQQRLSVSKLLLRIGIASRFRA